MFQIGLQGLSVSAHRWQAVCTIYGQLMFKIGFPGWPEPNLDWDSGFGGSVLEKGGLHQPPFSYLEWLEVGRVSLKVFPRVS